MKWKHAGETSRVTVTGRQGTVSSAHPLASAAGVQMLQAGGNAVDAAVAVAAALSVVEPYSTGAGGVGYFLIQAPGQDRPQVLDFVGPAPAAATPENLSGEGAPGLAAKDSGIRSPVVPGAVGGWLAALDRYGALDRSVVLQPAIELAERGFPMSSYGHRYIATAAAKLRRWPTSAAIYLPGGQPPPVGALFRQPEQAATLRAIAADGAAAFYSGPIAEEICRFSADNGGLLTLDDLAGYTPRWEDPISVTYRDDVIYCPGPPCSGMQYLMTLKILERFAIAEYDPASSDYVHLLAEACRLAAVDRQHWAARPDAPLDRLLSASYAAERAALIDPRSARRRSGERYAHVPQDGDVTPGIADRSLVESTTHFVTADDQGYLVACTYTLGGGDGGGFGSGVVHGSTGVMMNNFMHWFDDDPRSPNFVGPGKRVEMCLAPSQVWRNGKPLAAIGTPGSWGILQTTVQLLVQLLDYQCSVQAAVERPRFKLESGHGIAVEGRFPSGTLDELRRRGHDVRVLKDWDKTVGGAQGVLIDDEQRIFFAGADPRRDGYALGI